MLLINGLNRYAGGLHIEERWWAMGTKDGEQFFYLIKVFFSPTDAQVNCLKINFTICIKIDIKTAPTCFGAVTPSSGSALLVLAKVTLC
jgi:hypothetical protein